MPLGFTKKQNQVLEIFFHDPEKSFYLRQLARMLGVAPGVFQRDINKLVEKGILLSEFQANSRFFKLNKGYSLYPELKSIFFKTVGAEGKLKELFRKIKNIKAAFIFGSYAEGKEDALSDIDLMIIGDVNEKDFILDLRKVEEKLAREINYHIYAPEEWAKKTHNKEHFVKEINKKPKIFIVGDEKSLRKIC